MEQITSRQNPLMVLAHKLQNSRSERYRQRRYIADGTKLLEEAVRWDEMLETVILKDGLELPFALPEQVRQVRVPEQLMRQVSAMETPQGALFIGRIRNSRSLCCKREVWFWMASRIREIWARFCGLQMHWKSRWL